MAGKQRRALDSTILDDAVARQDTVTQLIAQIRRVGREVPGAQDLITAHCTGLAALTGQGYDQPGKPRIAWDDQAAREELVTALVNDALALLAALGHRGIEVLAGSRPRRSRCWRWSPARTSNPPRAPTAPTGGGGSRARPRQDRVISTVDPDARHAHKSRERRQDGFKAHLVVEPDTGLTTVVALTKATGPTNLRRRRRRGPGHHRPTLSGHRRRLPDQPVEVLGDSAYGTGDMLARPRPAGNGSR